MNQVSESLESNNVITNKQQLISSKDEIEELAAELADGYLEYFQVDLSEQTKKLDDSIEECLTHLEEVRSVLDIYQQKTDEPKMFIADMANKSVNLLRLYEQIDALEQYIYETNQLLDQLEAHMRDLEKFNNSGGASGMVRQLMDYIPRISLGNNVPRFGIFGMLSNIIPEPTPSFVDDSEVESNNAKIIEILDQVANIETSLASVTGTLSERLTANNESQSKPDSDSEAVIRNGSCVPVEASKEFPDELDSSWQELL